MAGSTKAAAAARTEAVRARGLSPVRAVGSGTTPATLIRCRPDSGPVKAPLSARVEARSNIPGPGAAGETDRSLQPKARPKSETALLPAPFWCTPRVDRPTSTGGWRERPALALLAWESLLAIRSDATPQFQGYFLICRKCGQKKKTTVCDGAVMDEEVRDVDRFPGEGFPGRQGFCVRERSTPPGRR